jgi:hypothetical protein
MAIVDFGSGPGYIRADPPRLGMARDQMLQPLHLRHPTPALDSLHVGAKPPLPLARLDDGFRLGVGDLGNLADVFNALLPSLEMGLPRWAHVRYDFLRDIRNLVGFAADETEQRRGKRPADLGVVHALQSVAVGAQR